MGKSLSAIQALTDDELHQRGVALGAVRKLRAALPDSPWAVTLAASKQHAPCSESIGANEGGGTMVDASSPPVDGERNDVPAFITTSTSLGSPPAALEELKEKKEAPHTIVRRMYCWNCGEPWHEGTSCSEPREQDRFSLDYRSSSVS